MATPRRSTQTLDGYVTPLAYVPPDPRASTAATTKAKKSSGRANRASNIGGARVQIDPRAGGRTGQARTASSGVSASSTQRLTNAPANVPNAPPKPRGKTHPELRPLWQDLDNMHEEEALRDAKRMRSGFVRSTGRGRRAGGGGARGGIAMRGPSPEHAAQLLPGLRLRVGGVLDPSDDEDEPEQGDAARYRPQARVVTEPIRKTDRSKSHAARKIEQNYWDTSSEPDDSRPEASDSASPSESSRRASALSHQSDSDIEIDNAPINPEHAPEIILLDAPPRFSSHFHPRPRRPAAMTPPSTLVTAIERLSFASLRMHATRRLPFLVRDLRRRFYARCEQLGVPVYTDKRTPRLKVLYTGAGAEDSEYVARVDGSWVCPLCDLLGALRTREMLDCHLRWDHAEVFCEWQAGPRMGEYVDDWELRVLIPENPDVDPISEGAAAADDIVKTTVPPERSSTPDRDMSRSTTLDPTTSSSSRVTPDTQRRTSLFPYVTLSPPIPQEPKEEVKPDVSTIYSVTPSASGTRGTSTTGSSGPGSSAQPSSITPSSSRAADPRPTASSSDARERPITPPPPSDPLGPAARAPFLPAESEYGGPTVLYSCRPQGAGLFDLLGTLPAGAWGLIEWDLRDREQEVLESDMVGEELKVMQAVWMRWSGVNRNLFITDYCKGAIAFVDEYWRIIHRGVGWSALRFFLLSLMANQFLTGREVARVLRHYEELTGMDE